MFLNKVMLPLALIATAMCSSALAADRKPQPQAEKKSAAPVEEHWGPYMADIQRRIKGHWAPIKGHETDRVTVTFKINSAGAMSDLTINKSSGYDPSDQLALQAVGKAAPFKPLPPGAPKLVDINFTFDYAVFSNQAHSKKPTRTEYD